MRIRNLSVWQRAATGDLDSVESLSEMCARKSLGEKDLATCIEILESNYEKISQNARVNLGIIHMKLSNFDRYLQILKLNMNNNHILSCHKLGKCYEYDAGCEKNLDLAKAYYTDAARGGHVFARARLLRVRILWMWLPVQIFIVIFYVLLNIAPETIYIFIRNLLKFRRPIDSRIKD